MLLLTGRQLTDADHNKAQCYQLIRDILRGIIPGSCRMTAFTVLRDFWLVSEIWQFSFLKVAHYGRVICHIYGHQSDTVPGAAKHKTATSN
jgi:hypothetical protein